MATNFEYISSVGALPVNLGRQQYGPLDGSSVFKSIVDLKYYILASRNPTAVSSLSETSAIYENASDYWKKIATRYAYVGQNVTVVDDSGVNNYKIVNVPTLEEISVVMSNDVFAEPNTKLFKKIADTESVDNIADALSNAISSKIYFNDYGTEKFGDLSVIKLGAGEYAELLDLSATNNQAIYIISSDNKDVYGLRIVNLADGSSLSDAVNLKQLTSTVSNVSVGLTSDISGLSSTLTTTISSVSSELTSDISGLSSTLTTTISSVSSELTSDISSVSSSLSNAISSKIFIRNFDGSGNELTAFDDISVLKMTVDEYRDLVLNDKLSTLSNSLFVISSDYINAYGTQVKNVGDATQDYDAVNLKQLMNASSTVISDLTTTISSVSSELSSDISSISSALSDAIITKIFFKEYDNPGIYGDLSVVKVKDADYAQILGSPEGANPQTIYIVSSENEDVYGGRITNLSDGVDDYDAVNLKQLAHVSSDITDVVREKIFFKEYDNPGEYNSLSIVKIGMDEYENLLSPDSDVGVDEHTIYFISSDNKNAYGGKIVNLADGTDPTDAINKSQLTNCLSGYPNLSSVNWNSVSLSTLVDMVKFAFSQLGGGQVSY